MTSRTESLRVSGRLLDWSAWLLPASLLVLVIVGAAVSPTFLQWVNIKNILIGVSSIGVLAIGQTIVMLVRQIDLSVGSSMAFSPILAIAMTSLILDSDTSSVIQGGNYVTTGLVPIIALTLGTGLAVGLTNGLLTIYAKVPSLIVTLGMMYMLRGLSYEVSGGRPLYLTRLDGFAWLGTTEVFGLVPVSFCVFIGLGLISVAALKFTPIGTRLYATGGNEKAALYSGVDIRFWQIAAFSFSGLCAGIAALLYCSRLESVEAAQASGYELAAIAIAVVGGTTLQGGRGKMSGTVLAALIVAIVINILSLQGLVVWYQTIIMGTVIIAAVFGYQRANSRAR